MCFVLTAKPYAQPLHCMRRPRKSNTPTAKPLVLKLSSNYFALQAMACLALGAALRGAPRVVIFMQTTAGIRII